MHSLPNETMPVLQYSREDNRLSCAATDRKKRLTFLRIAAINCDRFSFVKIRALHPRKFFELDRSLVVFAVAHSTERRSRSRPSPALAKAKPSARLNTHPLLTVSACFLSLRRMPASIHKPGTSFHPAAPSPLRPLSSIFH